MRTETLLAAVLTLLAVTALPADGQEPSGVPTATLSLEEVLRLYRENEKSREEVEARPPFAATVNKMELVGRLLEDAVDLTARFEVVVLADGEWVSVPLLERGASTVLSQLPSLDGAVLAVEDGRLSLTTKSAGTYRFEVAFLEKARTEGRRRTATVGYEEATLARLLLQIDEGLFRLDGAVAAPQGEGMTVLPADGRFTIAWEHLAETPRARRREVERPPIESVVTSAHGSAVSTLEGKSIVRLVYKLRFEGTRPIGFALPEGSSLVRVYLNRVAVPFAIDGTTFELDVEPRRAGDESGTVELVLESDRGGYNLSGDLYYELPRSSWPVNELYFDLHLPDVFNYTWTGGSLAPVESSPGAEYTYTVPLPGKRLAFHQYLISKTSPTLRVDYAIDLTEKYFCRRGAAADGSTAAR